MKNGISLRKGSMMAKNLFLYVLLCSMILCSGCALLSPSEGVYLTMDEINLAQRMNVPFDRMKELKAKRLYEFSPKDLNEYLPLAWELHPDFSDRVAHYARKAIGQPYKIYLLGEFPFEIYDSDPLFCLEKSDCMVFTEHIYAMSLSKDWPQFFSMLQRIRYENGEISTVMRNHTSVPQWVDNNSWLVKDITEEIAPDLTRPFNLTLDPNRALIKDYGLDPGFPKQKIETCYIPLENIPKIADKLQNGDYVCVIRGFSEEGLWSGHVGFITKNEDGAVNFLDSAGAAVRENPLLPAVEKANAINQQKKGYNEWVDRVKKDPSLLKPKRKFFIFKGKPEEPRKKWYHYGYKFYRPQQDPIKSLVKLDGKDAPVVTGPRGLLQNRKDKPAQKK